MKRINHYWYTSPILYQTNYVLYQFFKKNGVVLYPDENELFDTLSYIAINWLLITLNVAYSKSVPVCIHWDRFIIISPSDLMYHYDIFLIHMICFKIKKIKRGKLEKIYQLILWKWKTEIAFLRNQLHIWLLKLQNKKYQIDESKNNQKARNKRPNLHNLWGNNCQFSDNIFQWHFHLFRELEDGVVFPYKLNCSCVEKRLHVYILFF